MLDHRLEKVMSREVQRILLDMDSGSLDSRTELIGGWENISSFLPPPACALGFLLSLLQSLRDALSFCRVLNRERSRFRKGPRTPQTSLKLTVVMVASVC